MKHLALTGEHIFNVIPREYVSEINIELISETTNVKIERTVTSSSIGNYLNFVVDFGTLTEGDFYVLNILNGSEIIYKDKAFATAQTINQLNNEYYSVNKDVYITEDSADNDYIVL